MPGLALFEENKKNKIKKIKKEKKIVVEKQYLSVCEKICLSVTWRSNRVEVDGVLVEYGFQRAGVER